jgi:hypothetical protein
MSETAIAIANRLYEARRNLRGILRDGYAEHAAKWMSIVDAVAEGDKETHLRTCVKLLTDLQAKFDNGMAQMWVLAATVELMEPDEHTPDFRAMEQR